MDCRPLLSVIRQLSGQIPRHSSHSIGRGSAGARCAGSVVIGSAVHVPFTLARHKDKSPDFRPILADTFRETQAISRIATKRPISATVTRPGKSSVFRHWVLRTELPYVLAECGLGLRERIKRPEIGCRIRTISDPRSYRAATTRPECCPALTEQLTSTRPAMMRPCAAARTGSPRHFERVISNGGRAGSVSASGSAP